MAVATRQAELSIGSGADFGPGADWEKFVNQMLVTGHTTRTLRCKQIGLVAGQLTIEELGITDQGSVLDRASGFGDTIDTSRVEGDARACFNAGVLSAIQIERAKEAIAA
jgi:hypothetical protein